jgi:hypothetical protein
MTAVPIDLELVKTEVFAIASLEGEIELWAPFSAINGRFSGRGAANVGALVERAIQELVDEGKLMLLRVHWDEGSSDPTWTPLDQEEIRAELASTWWKELPIKPPADVWLIPTEDFERRLQRGPRGKLPG